MTTKISEGRKTLYYVGIVLIVAGVLLFGSTFVSAALTFGDFTDFSERTRSKGLRAIAGMGLILFGAVLRGIGSRGLAGSGVVLDPEQAREDLEPYSRQVGGMVKDALDAADLRPGGGQRTPVVMVKCRACAKLNEEDSKFCQECGKAL